MDYYEENGTLDGSTSAIMERASTEFVKGVAGGAAAGGLNGGLHPTKCFVAGTLVLTLFGAVAIESITPGTYVYAKDMDSNIQDWLIAHIEEYNELNKYRNVCGLEWAEPAVEIEGSLYMRVENSYFTSIEDIKRAEDELLSENFKKQNENWEDYYREINNELYVLQADGFSDGGLSADEVEKYSIQDILEGIYIFRTKAEESDEQYKDVRVVFENGDWKIDGITSYYKK